MAVELRQIIDTVKHLDYAQKEASNELNRVSNAYDDKLKDITGSGQLARQKAALNRLKTQVKALGMNEGVMLSTLFGSNAMRHGQSHFYDEVFNSAGNEDDPALRTNID